MRVKKFTKVAFYWLMRIFIFTLFGPPILLYRWVLRCCLAVQIHKLQRKGSNSSSQSSVGKYGTGRIVDMKEVADAEKLDFKMHRSRTYIDQITFGSLWELCDLASGRQRVSLVPNHVLQHVLFNSVFSYGLTKENNPHSEVAWRFSFEDIGDYKLFREFYWDVDEILVLKSGRLNIRDRTGTIHTPRCKTWPLAKAHVQAQLTFFAPGLAHNHVHFVLPSVIACEAGRKLPETSVLRQLLTPHSRFTQYINHQALNDCLSSSNSRSLSDRVLRPWLSMPINNADFISGIEKRCEKFYYEKGSMVPNLDDSIAYQGFLKMYYVIFHEFVNELSPLLKDDYKILRSAIAEHIPAVARESMVDVLAGFLWNSGVVHYCDHESYLRQWARKYGCMAIRVPLVKPEPVKKKLSISTISDGMVNGAYADTEYADKATVKNDKGEDVNVVIETYHYSAEDGSKFFRSSDVCRTRCFLRTFVQYNESSTINMKLIDTEYSFTDPLATKAAADFMTAVKDLSSILKQRGEAIVKGEDFIRSVCF